MMSSPIEYDVVALGEILIDFTPAGKSDRGNILFERNPGGAPANLLATISKLGRKSAFIGKVGDDLFGHFLISVLTDAGIDASGVRLSTHARTTLAFVQLDEKGDRSFSFYRNPGADTELAENEIDLSIISRSRIFHFGSLSLTDEPARSATFAALEHARNDKKTISYDPNLRPLLWESLDDAKEKILSAIHYADILKISEEEMEFLTGESDLEKGTSLLMNTYATPLILVTLGAQGCFYRTGSFTGRSAAFTDLESVDTTGAGDSFLGGFIYGMISRDIFHPSKLSHDNLSEISRFACAVAGLCTTKRGAIPALPTLREITDLLNNNRKGK
ncbi:MAG TPA: PfkB family carbohydrate kinase [Spirochaetota bacterium]